MKVGVVAYEMEGDRTGVGRYLEGLLDGIAGLDPPWRWVLFFHGSPFEHPLFAYPGFEPVFAGAGGRPLVWEQLRLPSILRRHGLDLIFSPSYSLPRAAPPAVVTIHDLSFERLPREFGWRQRWRRRLLARRACRRAARVLADREGIRRELIEHYHLPAAKVGVVPLGVDEQPAAAEGEAEALAALGVRPPYLLFLGTMLDRRRIDVLLAAFAAVRRRRPELQLVVAGANRLRRPGELDRWLADSALAGGVARLGYVPEEAVAALYRRAELSLYLSTYEGYGLPPLESLACGTPAVVSAGLGLDDLWPDYPYRCHDLTPASVAAVVEAALDDPRQRHAVAAQGVERMGRLTWRRSAEALLAELEAAVAGP